MKFVEIVEVQRKGLLKVADIGGGIYTIGDMRLSESKQLEVLRALGWHSHIHCKLYEAFKRTDSIVRNMYLGLDGNSQLLGLEVEFSCIRFESSMKFCERVVFKAENGRQLVILHGNTGTGKSFAVYTPRLEQANVPREKFSSYKRMCEWLNGYLIDNPV